MPPQPVYLSKSDIARRHIEELILTRAARPGDRITSREISDTLGMSETPIREAIRALAAEGWLDIQPHVGTVVASAGAEQLREIYALRGLVGGLAVKLGAGTYDAARFKAIDANISASRKAVAAQDVRRYTQLNHEFHTLLYDTPHSQWSLRMLVTLSALSSARYGFAMMPQRMAASLREHQAIRDAIHVGDYARAAKLIEQHENAGCQALAAKLAAETPRTAAKAV